MADTKKDSSILKNAYSSSNNNSNKDRSAELLHESEATITAGAAAGVAGAAAAMNMADTSASDSTVSTAVVGGVRQRRSKKEVLSARNVDIDQVVEATKNAAAGSSSTDLKEVNLCMFRLCACTLYFSFVIECTLQHSPSNTICTPH